MSPTDAEIDAATRVFCTGLPLDSHPAANTVAGMIARGRCMAPDCDCWEQGREVTRMALTAAALVREAAAS